MSSVKGFRKYGFWFPENFNELSVELFAYSITRGEWGKAYCEKHQIDLDEYSFENPTVHFINFCKMQWDSNTVCFESRGYQNSALTRLLDGLCNNDDIAVAGAASTTKSFGVGVWVLGDWQAVPYDTSTWVATTSLGASEDRIWGIVSKLHKNCKAQIGKLIDYRHMIIWSGVAFDEAKAYDCAVKALAFPPGGEGQKAIDTTRGRKGARARLAMDELPEMEPLAIKTKVNLAANDDCVFIGIGNPSADINPHTTWCLPKGCDDFSSVNPEMEQWETSTGICLYFNGKKSPNFDAPENEPSPFKFLLDRKKIARMLELCYGDENAVDYLRNAIGWWPKSGFIQTVLSEAVILGAETLQEPLWDFNGLKTIGGFDTSFTQGGDRCVLTPAKLGNIRGMAKKVLYVMPQEILIASGTTKEEFEVAMAKKVVATCIKYGIAPIDFGMDVSGDGGRMAQAIMKEWMTLDPTAMSIYLISSMGTPTERIVSSLDKRPCSEVYDRLISEYWYAVYHGFKTRSIYGVNHKSDLAREWCLRRYSIKNKKISVESKDDFKERHGFSPDCFIEGTLISTPRGDVEIQKLSIGDFVKTPFGKTRIAFIHSETLSSTIKCRFSNGRELQGKGKHRVFTFEKGWVRLDGLSTGYTVESVNKLFIWNILNLFFTKDETFSFKVLVDTIKTEGGIERKDFYTELYGLRKMDQFLEGCKSIIKMGIGLITELKIWNYYLNPITCDSIWQTESLIQNTSKETKKSWIQLDGKHQNGIHLLKELSGTDNTQLTPSEKQKNSKLLVNLAERFGWPQTEGQKCAHKLATCVKTGWLNSVKKGYVSIVKLLSSPISILNNLFAVRPVGLSRVTKTEKVLNLVLEKHNVYYANGILVDNCADSANYAIEMARRNGLQFIVNDKSDRQTMADYFREQQEVNQEQEDEVEMAYADGDDGEG